jgi:cbb3-type cytochrome oxidase subunit 3
MHPSELPLRDIHLPEAIGWWPPAIGWWLLAIFIPLLLGFIAWLYRRLTRKTAIKTAKKLLIHLKQDKTLDAQQKLRQLSTLLRRVAVSILPRTHAASLTGRAWLAFLDQAVEGSPFSDGIGQLLADAPYRASVPTETDIAALINLCEDWLKHCSKLASTKAHS